MTSPSHQSSFPGPTHPPPNPVVPPDDPQAPDVIGEPSIDPPPTDPPFEAPTENPRLPDPPPRAETRTVVTCLPMIGTTKTIRYCVTRTIR